MIASHTYTNEKQILKFYIRLLLYIENEHSKNETLKRDTGDENYLKFLTHPKIEKSLFEQFIQNQIRNNEDSKALDETFFKLFTDNLTEKQTQAEAQAEAQVVAPLEQGQALKQAEPQGEASIEPPPENQRGQYFDLPFTKATSNITRTLRLTADENLIVHMIKTMQQLKPIYDFLSNKSSEVQLKFIKEASPEAKRNNWNSTTNFSDAEVSILLTIAHNANKS